MNSNLSPRASAGAAVTTAETRYYRSPVALFSKITVICRVVGVIFTVIMFLIAISSLPCVPTGILLIIWAISMIFLESIWLIERFNIFSVKVLKVFTTIETYCKPPIYLILAIITFATTILVCWWTIFAGIFFLILSLLYTLKMMRFSSRVVQQTDFNAPPPQPRY